MQFFCLTVYIHKRFHYVYFTELDSSRTQGHQRMSGSLSHCYIPLAVAVEVVVVVVVVVGVVVAVEVVAAVVVVEVVGIVSVAVNVVVVVIVVVVGYVGAPLHEFSTTCPTTLLSCVKSDAKKK